MKAFNIIIASDTEHEKVYAEIYYNNKFVAIINQEKGPSHLLVEFPGQQLNEKLICRQMEMDLFLKALEQAKQKLICKAKDH